MIEKDVFRSSHRRFSVAKGVLSKISQNSQEKTCARASFLIKLQEILNVKYTECNRNLEFEKRTDQNFIPQNLRQGKEYCIRKKKKLLKQCLYEYILAFAGWWSIFWEMVGSGECILAGGRWW